MYAELELEIRSDLLTYRNSSNLQGVIMETIPEEYAALLHQGHMNPYSQFLLTEQERKRWFIRTLNKEAYEHLLTKADGIILTKKRYMIPVPGSDHLTIELDVFEGHYHGLILAEVEFASEEEAKAFNPPAWFGEDVTFSGEYHNSRLSQG